MGENMENQSKARGMMIASVVIFGTIALFVRSIPLPSAVIALCRAVLASLLIGGYLFMTGQRIDLKRIKKELVLLLMSGAAMGMNWILLFEAYNYTSVSAATLSYYFAPALVTALCPVLFREKLTARQVLCFVMATAGVVMITGVSGLESRRDLIGVLLGLGAAVLYAAVILINKFIRNVGGIHRTFLQFVSAVLVLTPYVLLTGGLDFSGMTAIGWASLVTVGLVHTGVTYCLYFTAMKELPGQKTAILSYIDPLVAVAISVTLLGEGLTLWQGVGGALVLGFTLLGELPAHTFAKRRKNA